MTIEIDVRKRDADVQRAWLWLSEAVLILLPALTLAPQTHTCTSRDWHTCTSHTCKHECLQRTIHLQSLGNRYAALVSDLSPYMCACARACTTAKGSL